MAKAVGVGELNIATVFWFRRATMRAPVVRQQIFTSVKEIKTQYEHTDLLEPSIYTCIPPIYERLNEDENQKMRKATKIVEVACALLCAIIMRLEDTLVNVSHAFSIIAYVLTSFSEGTHDMSMHV